MELCIVCLKSNEDIISRIHIDSKEWQEFNIQRIIEKHLWWWYLKNPITDATNSLQWICRQCWLELSTFHKFFLTVKKVHNQFLTMSTIYEIMEIDETAAKQEKIKQETEAQNEISPLEALNPLYKKQTDKKQNYNSSIIETEELHIMDIKNEVHLVKTVVNNEGVENKVDDETMIPKLNIKNEYDSSDEGDHHDVTGGNDNKDKIFTVLKDDSRRKTRSSGLKKAKTVQKTKSFANNKQKVSSRAKFIQESLSNEDCKKLFKETGYKLECSICQVGVADYNTLKTHFNKKHKIPVYTMCCGNKFTERYFIDHLNVHKNPEYFKCQRCNKSFKTRIYLSYHLKTHGPRERNFNCEKCDKSFYNNRHLIAHMVVHDDPEKDIRKKELSDEACQKLFEETNYKLVCSICQMPQVTFPTLIEHFKTHHNNISPYAMCCERQFPQRCLLIDHLNVHKNPKYFKCQPCKKSFPNRVVLKRHLKAHKNNPEKPLKINQPISAEACEEIFRKTQYKLECSICQVPQTDFRSLTMHFNREHKTRAYAMCCGKQFVKQCYLIDHLNLHANSKHFKCPHCNKVLASRRCLQNHVKIHEAARERHNCTDCDKSYSKKKLLEYHRLSCHVTDSEKNYPCSQCKKKFASDVLCRQHEYHHNRILKNCNICGQTFRGIASFKQHMNEQHANEGDLIPTTFKSEPIASFKQEMNEQHANEGDLIPTTCKSEPIASFKQEMNEQHVNEGDLIPTTFKSEPIF